jgi:hypothetical protein
MGMPILIFTNAYTSKKNLAFVTNLDLKLNAEGGKISYIQLVCDPTTLYQRVTAPERIPMGKIHSITHLKLEMGKDDYTSKIPFKPHYIYDTTVSPAKDIATMIIQDTGLQHLQ